MTKLVNLCELKGSEILKVEAAILEVVEEYGFSLDKDLGIVESQDNANNWIMAFTTGEKELEDLAEVKNKLGERFRVRIVPKSKGAFLFRIEGPSEEFSYLASTLKPLSAAPGDQQVEEPAPGLGFSPTQTFH